MTVCSSRSKGGSPLPAIDMLAAPVINKSSAPNGTAVHKTEN